MRTHASAAPLPAGTHPAETLSLLGGSRGHSARQGCVAVGVSPSADASDARAAAARARSRVVGLAAGALFALFALAALASAHDGFRASGADAVAALGRGHRSASSASVSAAEPADGDWLLGGARAAWTSLALGRSRAGGARPPCRAARTRAAALPGALPGRRRLHPRLGALRARRYATARAASPVWWSTWTRRRTRPGSA